MVVVVVKTEGLAPVLKALFLPNLKADLWFNDFWFLLFMMMKFCS
jgi:hypothetical protein